jgi:hypothetical protein
MNEMSRKREVEKKSMRTVSHDHLAICSNQEYWPENDDGIAMKPNSAEFDGSGANRI